MAHEDDVRQAAGAMIKESKQKREEVAFRLGIKTSQLNDWLTRGHFPADRIRAFCEVTAGNELAMIVLPEELQRLIEIGSSVTRSRGDLARVAAILEKYFPKK